jgi:hypothetical protein
MSLLKTIHETGDLKDNSETDEKHPDEMECGEEDDNYDSIGCGSLESGEEGDCNNSFGDGSPSKPADDTNLARRVAWRWSRRTELASSALMLERTMKTGPSRPRPAAPPRRNSLHETASIKAKPIRSINADLASCWLTILLRKLNSPGVSGVTS